MGYIIYEKINLKSLDNAKSEISFRIYRFFGGEVNKETDMYTSLRLYSIGNYEFYKNNCSEIVKYTGKYEENNKSIILKNLNGSDETFTKLDNGNSLTSSILSIGICHESARKFYLEDYVYGTNGNTVGDNVEKDLPEWAEYLLKQNITEITYESGLADNNGKFEQPKTMTRAQLIKVLEKMTQSQLIKYEQSGAFGNPCKNDITVKYNNKTFTIESSRFISVDSTDGNIINLLEKENKKICIK